MIAGLEELLVAAANIEAFLARQGWKFCFIGVRTSAEPHIGSCDYLE
jgi:hypothetical protein